jgi:dTDP-4-dehydrorhamnose reductase
VIHNRILILGASGYIGNALYRELDSYFDVYGTYCTQDGLYAENQVFYKFHAETDSLLPLLEKLKPRYIISAFTSEQKASLNAHRDLIRYCELLPMSRVIYSSSSEVFDAQKKFPAYEYDKPLAESQSGRNKLAIEKLLLEQIPLQTTIIRLPVVLGINAPIIMQLRQAMKHKAAFEVFPKRIISATTAEKIAQQVHYIINKDLVDIYHLSSTDVVHHDDIFREIALKIGDNFPVFKKVFSSNEDEYQAILPKENLLPEPYRITIAEIIESSTLHDEIISLKN